MSQTLPSESHRDRTRPRSSALWIALSFLISALILGWTFTLPFRQGGQSLVSSKTTTVGGSSESDPSKRFDRRESDAESYRAAAIETDREFMRSVAQKQSQRVQVPGRRDAKVHWERRVESAKRELDSLKDAEEGSLEWQYREKLVRTLQDRP